MELGSLCDKLHNETQPIEICSPMRRTDLTDLAAFSCIAAHRNFRRAALELGLSPSALSHRMRSLEEQMGVRLLNRTTRSVSLSEAGVALLDRLQPALQDIQDAVEAVNAFRDSPTGTLRLNAPRTAIQLVVAPLIAKFTRAYPGMRLEIVPNKDFVDIVREGFDAGIRFEESLERDMIAVPIGPPQRFAVVASPEYIHERGMPLTPYELGNHLCIGSRFPSGKLYRWEFEKDGKTLDIVPDSPLILEDQDMMARAALDGAGMACVFEPYALPHIANGSLVRVLEDWCPSFPGFFLYYPSRRQMPAGLRAFIDMVKADRAG